MSTLSWPTSKHFRPGLPYTFGLSSPQAGMRGLYTGNTEGSKRLADRLVCRFSLAACTAAEGADRSAFLNGALSRGDWFSFGPFHQASSIGNVAACVVSGAHSALARSVLVTKVRALNNLLVSPIGLNNTAVWTAVGGAVVGVDAATAPDGTTTADSVKEGSGVDVNGHGMRQAVTATATTYTMSWYAKSLERTRCAMWAFGVTADVTSAIYDLSGGTASGTGSPTITSVGGGWWRCTRQVVASSGGTLTIHLQPQDGTSTQGYSGDGTSRVLLWGAQLEQGTSATALVASPFVGSGDWLAIGGNLYQADYGTAVADQLSGMRIYITTPLAEALADAAAVTTQSPTGTWELDEQEMLSFDFSAGALQQGVNLAFRQRIV